MILLSAHKSFLLNIYHVSANVPATHESITAIINWAFTNDGMHLTRPFKEDILTEIRVRYSSTGFINFAAQYQLLPVDIIPEMRGSLHIISKKNHKNTAPPIAAERFLKMAEKSIAIEMKTKPRNGGKHENHIIAPLNAFHI